MPRATPLFPKANILKRRTKQPTVVVVHDGMARRRRRSRCTQCGRDRSAMQCNANAGELLCVQLQARGGGPRSSGWQ